MWTFLAASLLIFSVGLLYFYGRKLLHYKPKDTKETVNIFEELKDLKSIKINLVSASELYSYFAGAMLLFLAYYIVVTQIGALFAQTGILWGALEAGMFLPFYLFCFFLLFWKISFFIKAVLPNLKHGERIKIRIYKLMKITAVSVALPIWISGIFHLLYGDNGDMMILGLLAGAFLLISVPIIAIQLELTRLGVPDLYEGIKDLMQKSEDKD